MSQIHLHMTFSRARPTNLFTSFCLWLCPCHRHLHQKQMGGLFLASWIASQNYMFVRSIWLLVVSTQGILMHEGNEGYLANRRYTVPQVTHNFYGGYGKIVSQHTVHQTLLHMGLCSCVSVRTWPWSSRRMSTSPMSPVFFYITWMAMYMCNHLAG